MDASLRSEVLRDLRHGCSEAACGEDGQVSLFVLSHCACHQCGAPDQGQCRKRGFFDANPASDLILQKSMNPGEQHKQPLSFRFLLKSAFSTAGCCRYGDAAWIVRSDAPVVDMPSVAYVGICRRPPRATRGVGGLNLYDEGAGNRAALPCQRQVVVHDRIAAPT